MVGSARRFWTIFCVSAVCLSPHAKRRHMCDWRQHAPGCNKDPNFPQWYLFSLRWSSFSRFYLMDHFFIIYSIYRYYILQSVGWQYCLTHDKANINSSVLLAALRVFAFFCVPFVRSPHVLVCLAVYFMYCIFQFDVGELGSDLLWV